MGQQGCPEIAVTTLSGQQGFAESVEACPKAAPLALPGQQGCPEGVVTTLPGQEGVAESVEACPELAAVALSGQKRVSGGRGVSGRVVACQSPTYDGG